jgi:hypothetical protein
VPGASRPGDPTGEKAARVCAEAHTASIASTTAASNSRGMSTLARGAPTVSVENQASFVVTWMTSFDALFHVIKEDQISMTFCLFAYFTRFFLTVCLWHIHFWG